MLQEVFVSRIQLALNVTDLHAAVDFYSKLFATEPAKIRSGYANFAIADPPLKLVLIEHPDGRGHGIAGALNHLGVEVECKIAEASSFTVALGKQAYYAQIDLDQPKAYAYAKEVMTMNSLAEDAQEGISAFLEKRAACWSGK